MRTFLNAEEIRRAAIIAAAKATGATLEETISGSGRHGLTALRIAISLIHRIQGLSLIDAARMLGVSAVEAATADKIFRSLRPNSKLQKLFTEAVNIFMDPNSSNPNDFPLDDSIAQLTSTRIAAKLATVVWLIHKLNDDIKNLQKTFESIQSRSDELLFLDRLIASGWGDTPREKLPPEVSSAAALSKPVPPKDEF